MKELKKQIMKDINKLKPSFFPKWLGAIEEEKKLSQFEGKKIPRKRKKQKTTPHRVWSIKRKKYEDEFTEAEIEADVEYGMEQGKKI